MFLIHQSLEYLENTAPMLTKIEPQEASSYYSRGPVYFKTVYGDTYQVRKSTFCIDCPVKGDFFIAAKWKY